MIIDEANRRQTNEKSAMKCTMKAYQEEAKYTWNKKMEI